MADDAYWFRRFPWMGFRCRSPAPAERAEYVWQFGIILTDQIAVFRNGRYALLVTEAAS
jgi:hypothetical protein